MDLIGIRGSSHAEACSPNPSYTPITEVSRLAIFLKTRFCFAVLETRKSRSEGGITCCLTPWQKAKGKRAPASQGRGQRTHPSQEPILLVTKPLRDNGVNPLKRAVLSRPDHFLKVPSCNTADCTSSMDFWGHAQSVANGNHRNTWGLNKAGLRYSLKAWKVVVFGGCSDGRGTWGGPFENYLFLVLGHAYMRMPSALFQYDGHLAMFNENHYSI